MTSKSTLQSRCYAHAVSQSRIQRLVRGLHRLTSGERTAQAQLSLRSAIGSSILAARNINATAALQAE
jgi:hypothetical protein